MNWDYIAGFFDGEGYVSLACPRGSGSLRASMAQSGKVGLKTLQEISEFMYGFGIRSKINCKSEETPEHEAAYSLDINKRDSILLFLHQVAGRLRIKRTIAQDLLRHSVVFPKFEAREREMVLKESRGY